MKREQRIEMDLSWRDAAILVLHEADRPMHCAEIADEIVKRKLRRDFGTMPEVALNATITLSQRVAGKKSPFLRVAPGTYRLRKGTRRPAPEYSWYDAAVLVLREARTSLHVGEVFERVVKRGLRKTMGNEPCEALASMIRYRLKAMGDSAPIVRVGPGIVALREHVGADRLRNAVELREIGSDSWRKTTMRAIREAQRGRTLRTGEDLLWLDAVEIVLQDAGRAMHNDDIVDEIVRRRLRQPPYGVNPYSTVRSMMARTLGSMGNEAPFVRIRSGVYEFRPRKKRHSNR